MVFVSMGAEDVFQLLDPLTLQVGDHQTAVVHIAAVIEHELSVALHQHAQCLPHVDEVHLKRGIDGVHGGGRRRRVGDDVGAAARDNTRDITGGQTQSQRRRNGQRGQTAEQSRLLGGGHFFFLEVFHVAFSFC